VKTVIDFPPVKLSMSGSTECGCEGLEQGLTNCLAEIKRVEENLIFVAAVIGLPTVIFLGAACIWCYIWCCEKQSKRTRKAKESKKRKRKDQWEEDVTNMESRLKANKVRRKERRLSAQIAEQQRTTTREIEALRERSARLVLENKPFLKRHPQYKAPAESKL
jgi:flagellar biosynthesis component FlhA